MNANLYELTSQFQAAMDVAPNNGYAAQDSDFADMTDDDGDVPF